MPDYADNDPKGWGGDPSRGAAIGRPSKHVDTTPTGRLYLRRVRLNSGGYDRNGTYFGLGAPLYWCAGDYVDFMLRACDREDAKDKVRKQYPGATFF